MIFIIKKRLLTQTLFPIHLRIIRQMELIERIEHKAHDHADDSGEGHAGERYIAQRQRNAGQAVTKITEVRIILRFLL